MRKRKKATKVRRARRRGKEEGTARYLDFILFILLRGVRLFVGLFSSRLYWCA